MRPSIPVLGMVLHLLTPLALATSVSLPDFAPLPSTVGRLCALAYDAPIPGCSRSDFSGDATCSDDCILGLQSLAGTINTVCFGVQVSSKTLLAKIFQGLIVESLCSNSGGDTSTQAPAQPSSTTPAVVASTPQSTPAPKSAASAAPSSSASSAPEVGPQGGSSTTSAAAASTSSPAADSSSNPTSTPAANNQPSSSSFSSSSSAATAAGANQTPSPKPDSNARPGLTVQQKQIAAMANSGGGSPFDIVGYSAANRPSSSPLVLWMGVAIVWVGVLGFR